MADTLRYHWLNQLEQHTPDPDSPIGLWQLSPHSLPILVKVNEIEAWAWRGIRFYRAIDSRSTWVGIPEGMDLDAAAETIAERLGIVDVSERLLPVPEVGYSSMTVRKLILERTRLGNELIGKNVPTEPFERLALIDALKADVTNAIAQKLAKVEEALKQKEQDA